MNTLMFLGFDESRRFFEMAPGCVYISKDTCSRPREVKTERENRRFGNGTEWNGSDGPLIFGGVCFLCFC